MKATTCPGTPGAASWGRCEKANGHPPPCTHDPDRDADTIGGLPLNPTKLSFVDLCAALTQTGPTLLAAHHKIMTRDVRGARVRLERVVEELRRVERDCNESGILIADSGRRDPCPTCGVAGDHALDCRALITDPGFVSMVVRQHGCKRCGGPLAYVGAIYCGAACAARDGA